MGKALPKTGIKHSFQKPQRTRSWGRRTSQIVVLVTSNESLYLVDEGSLDRKCTLSLPKRSTPFQVPSTVSRPSSEP